MSSDPHRPRHPAAARSILFVHAHPDDESINNGATMARYAAEGARVTLVTCTRGEFGEIMVPELEHLAWEREDRLGEHRERELAAALDALGVRGHRFLGGPGEYHDSGMMGTEGNERPDAFWQADPDKAAERLAEVVREVRPQVLVTYNEIGGYGHPDHIQAHRVALRAADLVAGTDAAIARVYCNVMPRSVAARGLEELRAAGGETGFSAVGSVDELPYVEKDDAPDTVERAERYVPAKAAAMRAHATQVSVAGSFYALSDRVGMKVFGTEYYRQARGDLPQPGQPLREGLFAGLGV